MPFAFLLALQASGMVMDYFGNRNQIEMARMGEKITQAGIASDIAMTRLESEDASLQAMKTLRSNLGTQAALNAARGVRSGIGSALAVTTESVSNFNADERLRKLNLSAKEANLKAKSVMSRLHQDSSEAKIWSDFRRSVVDKVPTSSAGWGGGGSFSGSKASASGGSRNLASGNLSW